MTVKNSRQLRNLSSSVVSASHAVITSCIELSEMEPMWLIFASPFIRWPVVLTSMHPWCSVAEQRLPCLR